jgi:periplasmic divalent cation tolerance protein
MTAITRNDSNDDASEMLLVATSLPARAQAEELARILVKERLAACVNILAECQSIFEWEGRLEQESEVPLVIKTSRSRFDSLQNRITELHPYEVPEIVAIPVCRALPAYAAWVLENTRP